MSYSDRHPCRHCDRTTEEVASCPSSQSTACASLLVHKAVMGIDKLQKRIAKSGNYIADKEVDPTRILFANGRVVRLVRGKLVVGWDRDGAAKAFHVERESSMTPRDPRAVHHLAVAIDQYHEWRMDVAMFPKVGDAFVTQLRNRERAERDLRKAFKDVTGMTLVRGRGGHGWRVRD